MQTVEVFSQDNFIAEGSSFGRSQASRYGAHEVVVLQQLGTQLFELFELFEGQLSVFLGSTDLAKERLKELAEFGASTQLEKIDMLDHARIVVINKFERRGAADALRDVRRQFARNHELFTVNVETLPVFGTVAARFNDDGVTAVYQHLTLLLADKGLALGDGCIVEAGLYVTGGTIVQTPEGQHVKARELSGADRLLFRRNSVSGGVEVLPASGTWQGLNAALHAN